MDDAGSENRPPYSAPRAVPRMATTVSRERTLSYRGRLDGMALLASI
jgi:hypothetical protein